MSIPAYNLSEDNYYSPEADSQYMSASQYKAFLKCEAAALASIRGEWEEPTSDAMLVGSYVHSAVEGTLDKFKAEHPEILTQKGQLRAEYKKADEMVHVLFSDEMIVDCITGLKEFVITADFAGCVWKAKLDVYVPDKRIVDVKTVKAIHDKVWDPQLGRYVSFVEGYGYIRQMAIYAELERIWAERDTWISPLIVAVTKEEIPDKAIIGMNEDDLAVELAAVQSNIPRILAVKNGFEEPIRCESCKYCRSTKQLKHIIYFRDMAI